MTPVQSAIAPFEEAPELALWRDVVLLAIRDCRESAGKRDGRDAQAWIFSTSDDPASFRWTCGLLGVDPRAVRRRVLQEPADDDRSARSSEIVISAEK